MSKSPQPPQARPWHQSLPSLVPGRSARLRYRREGDALRGKRNWTEAAQAYERHLGLNPDDHAIWIQYGHVLKEAGQLRSALTAYERSVQLKPADFDRDGHMEHLRRRIQQDGPVASPTGMVPPDGTSRDTAARPRPRTPRPLQDGVATATVGLIADRLRRA